MLADHLGFLDALREQLHPAQQAGTLLAVALVHLPAVTRADPLLGYRAGDQIAYTAANMLRQVLKPADRVYRVDRANLACVLTGLGNEAQAHAGAFKILRTLGAQVEVGGHFIHSNPAIGLALFPTHGTDADVLLQRASLALQDAHAARDRITAYDAERDMERQYELHLQTNLKNSIDENDLSLRYQPQLDLQTGAIAGCEALARWHHGTLGDVEPNKFIRAAEAAGWMPHLTRWLLHTCLRQQPTSGKDLALSVNLSAQDLLEQDLPDLVGQALATWNMRPDRLVLEVTETAVMEHNAHLHENLALLRQLGVRLSIDDFGTGYSSLARLKILPVDEIKIDVSFVRDMIRNAQDERIVRSVIDLAHNLGIAVIAEGVENRATMERLAEFGCDLAQGFFISPPLPAGEFAQFMQTYEPRPWTRRA
jgi:predicted signal transduction protein with EAL and GGDEF domain